MVNRCASLVLGLTLAACGASFTAELPPAVRYVVVINDHRLPAVTLAELRAEGLRHTFRLPS